MLLPEPEVLFGVELELGLVVLLGFELLLGEVVSVLLEPELGEAEVLLPEGEVEFMSELLEPVDEDGEVEVLEPVWLDEVEGELCELCAPLPAPLPSFPEELLELWAIARPVEKSTAAATVKSFLPMCFISCALV